jgi:hypothetical protein
MMQDISQLREELETLVSEHLPQVWSNGDVRYLNKCLYHQIVNKYLVLKHIAGSRVRGSHDFHETKTMEYHGQFGVILLKPSD